MELEMELEMMHIQGHNDNPTRNRGRFSKYSRGVRQFSHSDPSSSSSLSSLLLLSSSQRKHCLLVWIVLAFLVGFLVGKRESTPAHVSAVVGKLGEWVGVEPEPSIDQLLGQLTQARMTLERRFTTDRKSTRLNSSHPSISRMPSSA